MINLIVAYDKNKLIGDGIYMPWNIPEDMAHFKKLTMENVVIFGRKTYEGIGRPLPNRINIIVSNSKNFSGENLFTAKTLEEAIKMFPKKEIFIAGGRSIYKQALPLCDILYITEIDGEFKGNTYFPNFDESLYKKEIIGETYGEYHCKYIKATKQTAKNL